jgi:ubiquinone/menaquinone biosynthesis C-methylase UbiE
LPAGLFPGKLSLTAFAAIAVTKRKPQGIVIVRPETLLTLEQAKRLLATAAPLLRLPACPEQLPEVLPDGTGLRCPLTDRVYPYRYGVLDLLESSQPLTPAQQMLNKSWTAWAYARFRDTLRRLWRVPDFKVEVANIQEKLRAEPGDIVLDLACGHGNFTIEWAQRVGPEGLVLGLDISPAMLAHAVARVQREELTNILLLRGDALHLPLADQCLEKVNCSGGFHQFPDLPQALREIARVSKPGAVLTASAFAKGPNDPRAGLKHRLQRRFKLHFVPLAELEEQLAAVGYRDYQWSLLPGGWFGYTSARKAPESEGHGGSGLPDGPR